MAVSERLGVVFFGSGELLEGLMRRSVILSICLACLAVIAAPALAAKGKGAPFRVWTERDNFKPGVVMVRSTPITVKDVKFTSPWFAFLEAGYVYAEDGSFGTYVLDIMYHGPEWMFWDQLTAKVSPEDVRSLSLIGLPRRETKALGLEERIRFEVPRDLFEKMAAAPSVDFRVNGKYYYDFFLNSTGTSFLAQVQKFVQENAPELAAPKVSGAEPPGGTAETNSGSSAPSYVRELRELAKLRDEGILSEEEFQAKKRALLGLDAEPTAPPKGMDPAGTVEDKDAPAVSPPSGQGGGQETSLLRARRLGSEGAVKG